MSSKFGIISCKVLRAADFCRMYSTQIRIACVTIRSLLEEIKLCTVISQQKSWTFHRVQLGVMMKTFLRALWNSRTFVSLSLINYNWTRLPNQCLLHSVMKIMEIGWCLSRRTTVQRGYWLLKKSMMLSNQELLHRIVMWTSCSHQVQQIYNRKEIFKLCYIHPLKTSIIMMNINIISQL
jgi:hypothetical protein